MDRGRVGGFITDNNFSGIQIKKKMQREHAERLEKIKHRKPGSSITLDNNPPVVIKAALSNPRKYATRHYFNFITECENKSLLKRISTILTAPPTITDKEYRKLKKLCVTPGRGLKAQYEQKLVEEKNKRFFDHLKNTKAYYKAKEWEKDYEKQYFNQKFMRQVKYRRPEGFVDKFLEESKKEEEERLKRQKLTSSHVDRIREYKLKVGKVKKLAIGGGSPSSSTISSGKAQLTNRDRTRGGGHGINAGNDKSEYTEEFFEDYDNKKGDLSVENVRSVNFDVSSFTPMQQQPSENRVPLASTQRIIKVTKLTSPIRKHHRDDSTLETFLNNRLPSEKKKQDFLEETLFLNASIECFLINRDFLVVSVICSIDEETLEVEAEISSQELSAFSPDEIKPTSNLAFLSEVAQEVVDNVEVKVNEDSESRLVLNLFSNEVETENDSNNDVNRWNSINNVSLSSNEELTQILLPDRTEEIFTGGVHITVAFILNMSHSIGNFTMLVDMAKRSQKTEKIYALLKICNTYDDQLLVTAYTISTTTEIHKRGTRVRPAVVAGTTLKLFVPLPSIVQADPEMISSFAENLSQNLKIEHDCRSGENTLVMSNPIN